ncbi:hypothetical protein FGE12_26375 [Aggregicoccus sp. 17bor-14]|uniref:hypothetical protein n=1 Tax=Myxococcaceae TaxID=31 RepID=UPI00129C875C|nr:MULTISPECIES: hypothetical protein [Myxococcaceae]MBF5045966.1 hypothetical protein [Simulacricoccus sp. 17bor-14]MRI91698.1 hypothetical protein [Aggregicoccus sp. 17bor-14]
MSIAFEGRRHEVLLGSDVVDDGMYLELADASDRVAGASLLVFRSDADGRMTFSGRCKDLPLEAVEWFLAEAKRRLVEAEDAP